MRRVGALAIVVALGAAACGSSDAAEGASHETVSPDRAEASSVETERAETDQESDESEPPEASLESRCYQGEREACDQLGH